MAYVPRVRNLIGGGNFYSGNPGIILVNFDPSDTDYQGLIKNLPDGTLIIQNGVPGEDCTTDCAAALYIKTCSTCDVGYVSQITGSTGENTFSVNGLSRFSQRVSRTGDTWTDGGGASGTLVLNGTIPAGALVVQAHIKDVVGFTGNVSATLTIGDGTDADRYNTGLPSVFATAAVVPAGAPSGTAYHATAVSTITLTLTGSTDFGAITAGAATIEILYYDPTF